jgi:hypothetical protein
MDWKPFLRRAIMVLVVVLAIFIAVQANDWRWGAAFLGTCWAASCFTDF